MTPERGSSRETGCSFWIDYLSGFTFLRCQLVHGASTFSSSLNRTAMLIAFRRWITCCGRFFRSGSTSIGKRIGHHVLSAAAGKCGSAVKAATTQEPICETTWNTPSAILRKVTPAQLVLLRQGTPPAVWSDQKIALEMEIRFPLDRAGKYQMLGYIDGLAKTDDNGWQVHDYKTNKSLPSQQDKTAIRNCLL